MTFYHLRFIWYLGMGVYVWVFGGVERHTGNCFLVVVPNRSASTLLAVIKEWIKPGTIIIFGLLESYTLL
jgi:hypothetical protein